MRRIVFSIILLFVLQSHVFSSKHQHIQEVRELLYKVDSVIAGMHSLQFKVLLYARMRGDDYNQLSVFKIQRSPLKIYYKQFYGNNIELIYDQTVDEKKALVNPDGFPFTSIRLSPTSPRILERQHHSVFEADPQFILKQVKTVCSKHMSHFGAIVLDTVYKGCVYKKVIITDKQHKLETIHIKKRASVIDFAQSLGINYYSLVWFNENLKVDSELKLGSVLRVPTTYAKSFIFLVHPSTYIIRYVEVLDMDGVFEWFEYQEFNYEVLFSSDDFNPKNPNYNF